MRGHRQSGNNLTRKTGYFFFKQIRPYISGRPETGPDDLTLLTHGFGPKIVGRTRPKSLTIIISHGRRPYKRFTDRRIDTKSAPLCSVSLHRPHFVNLTIHATVRSRFFRNHLAGKRLIYYFINLVSGGIPDFFDNPHASTRPSHNPSQAVQFKSVNFTTQAPLSIVLMKMNPDLK